MGTQPHNIEKEDKKEAPEKVLGFGLFLIKKSEKKGGMWLCLCLYCCFCSSYFDSHCYFFNSRHKAILFYPPDRLETQLPKYSHPFAGLLHQSQVKSW